MTSTTSHLHHPRERPEFPEITGQNFGNPHRALTTFPDNSRHARSGRPSSINAPAPAGAAIPTPSASSPAPGPVSSGAAGTIDRLRCHTPSRSRGAPRRIGLTQDVSCAPSVADEHRVGGSCCVEAREIRRSRTFGCCAPRRPARARDLHASSARPRGARRRRRTRRPAVPALVGAHAVRERAGRALMSPSLRGSCLTGRRRRWSRSAQSR